MLCVPRTSACMYGCMYGCLWVVIISPVSYSQKITGESESRKVEGTPKFVQSVINDSSEVLKPLGDRTMKRSTIETPLPGRREFEFFSSPCRGAHLDSNVIQSHKATRFSVAKAPNQNIQNTKQISNPTFVSATSLSSQPNLIPDLSQISRQLFR